MPNIENLTNLSGLLRRLIIFKSIIIFHYCLTLLSGLLNFIKYPTYPISSKTVNLLFLLFLFSIIGRAAAMILKNITITLKEGCYCLDKNCKQQKNIFSLRKKIFLITLLIAAVYSIVIILLIIYRVIPRAPGMAINLAVFLILLFIGKNTLANCRDAQRILTINAILMGLENFYRDKKNYPRADKPIAIGENETTFLSGGKNFSSNGAGAIYIKNLCPPPSLPKKIPYEYYCPDEKNYSLKFKLEKNHKKYPRGWQILTAKK